MKKLLKEFKEFAVRGNVIDMAVGVIVGGAFSKIVSSLVADVILSLIHIFIDENNVITVTDNLRDQFTLSSDKYTLAESAS